MHGTFVGSSGNGNLDVHAAISEWPEDARQTLWNSALIRRLDLIRPLFHGGTCIFSHGREFDYHNFNAWVDLARLAHKTASNSNEDFNLGAVGQALASKLFLDCGRQSDSYEGSIRELIEVVDRDASEPNRLARDEDITPARRSLNLLHLQHKINQTFDAFFDAPQRHIQNPHFYEAMCLEAERLQLLFENECALSVCVQKAYWKLRHHAMLAKIELRDNVQDLSWYLGPPAHLTDIGAILKEAGLDPGPLARKALGIAHQETLLPFREQGETQRAGFATFAMHCLNGVRQIFNLIDDPDDLTLAAFVAARYTGDQLWDTKSPSFFNPEDLERLNELRFFLIDPTGQGMDTLTDTHCDQIAQQKSVHILHDLSLITIALWAFDIPDCSEPPLLMDDEDHERLIWEVKNAEGRDDIAPAFAHHIHLFVDKALTTIGRVTRDEPEPKKAGPRTMDRRPANSNAPGPV